MNLSWDSGAALVLSDPALVTGRLVTESVSLCHGVRRIGRCKHKRRNNFVILYKLRLAIRPLYFCSLTWRTILLLFACVGVVVIIFSSFLS